MTHGVSLPLEASFLLPPQKLLTALGRIDEKRKTELASRNTFWVYGPGGRVNGKGYVPGTDAWW